MTHQCRSLKIYNIDTGSNYLSQAMQENMNEKELGVWLSRLNEVMEKYLIAVSPGPVLFGVKI